MNIRWKVRKQVEKNKLGQLKEKKMIGNKNLQEHEVKKTQRAKGDEKKVEKKIGNEEDKIAPVTKSSR